MLYHGELQHSCMCICMCVCVMCECVCIVCVIVICKQLFSEASVAWWQNPRTIDPHRDLIEGYEWVCVCVCPVFYGRGVLNISVPPAECVSWRLRGWKMNLTKQNEVWRHSKERVHSTLKYNIICLSFFHSLSLSLMIRYNKNVDLIRHTALIRGGNNITHTEAVFQIHIRVWYYRSLKRRSNDSSTLMMQISIQLLISLSLLDVSSLLIKVMVSPKETSVEKETGWKWSERLYMLFRGMLSVFNNKFMKHRVSSLQNETNLTRFRWFHSSRYFI